MARAQFADTVMYKDATSGDLKPANNARVSVYAPGTTTLQTIYTTRSAGTTKANPFTTDATGAAEFWAELADYDVKLEDLEVPARFGTKTIGWQSSNPTVIPYASLDAVTTRQFAPIGAVISWWRPNDTVSLPTGWVQCDGATYASGNHDFGTGASITVPDLRNRFILGASSTNTDGQTGNGSDISSGAPGIRGTGGSNAHTLTSAQMPSHTHTVSVSGTTNTTGDHTHNFTENTGTDFMSVAGGGVGSHFHFPELTTTSTAGNHSHTVSASGTTASAGSGAAHNNMPLYVGLLQIIKIKRS